MSSDKRDASTITVVPLGTTIFQGSLISHELTELITWAYRAHEKVLILYNRRGSGRAWICQDCGYFPKCPHCDIALAYHTTPKTQLICHQCNFTMHTIWECPSCHGFRFQSIGIGIQKIESDISRLFPDMTTMRMDSDIAVKKSELISHIKDRDILIGTHVHTPLLQRSDIAHVVFLLFESDITLPDYRTEEDVYHMIAYAKKSGKHIFIQTHTPEHPLLSLIIEGNYRDFLDTMSRERKKYHYPPYAQFAVLRIHDTSKERVQDIIAKLVNKISLLKTDDIFMASDRDIWEKNRWEWIQKIILKGPHLEVLLNELEVEIVKNRAVTLEWR